MSSWHNDLLQTRALKSNVNSLRSFMSSTDNTSKHCIDTVPYTYQRLMTWNILLYVSSIPHEYDYVSHHPYHRINQTKYNHSANHGNQETGEK